MSSRPNSSSAALDGGPHLGGVHDVGRDRQGTASETLDRASRLGGAIRIDLGDHHVGAVAGERLDDASADPGAATGHHPDLTAEIDAVAHRPPRSGCKPPRGEGQLLGADHLDADVVRAAAEWASIDARIASASPHATKASTRRSLVDSMSSSVKTEPFPVVAVVGQAYR